MTAERVATSIVGSEHVDGNTPPIMGAEDFSYMLEARPGAFVFIGNGNSAGLHHPGYDFNDDAIPLGIQYWVNARRDLRWRRDIALTDLRTA